MSSIALQPNYSSSISQNQDAFLNRSSKTSTSSRFVVKKEAVLTRVAKSIGSGILASGAIMCVVFSTHILRSVFLSDFSAPNFVLWNSTVLLGGLCQAGRTFYLSSKEETPEAIHTTPTSRSTWVKVAKSITVGLVGFSTSCTFGLLALYTATIPFPNLFQKGPTLIYFTLGGSLLVGIGSALKTYQSLSQKHPVSTPGVTTTGSPETKKAIK